MLCGGLNLSLIYPSPSSSIPTGETEIVVLVTLGCGSPVTSGGRWDSKRFEAKGQVEMPDRRKVEFRLSPVSERPSEFSARIEFPSPGAYHFQIEAFDPETGNIGRCSATLNVFDAPNG